MPFTVYLFVVLAIASAFRVIFSRSRRPLPPGLYESFVHPFHLLTLFVDAGPRSFLFGFLWRIPTDQLPWLTFAKWGEQFASDTIFFSLLGRRMLVVNSYKAAVDLLETRGAIYADRPSTTMSGELVGRKHTVFFVSSTSPRFRIYRKIMQAALNRSAAETYYPLQMVETRKFLKGLLQSPESFRSLIRRTAGAVILKLTFGYDVQSDHDPLVQLADKCIRISEEAAKPGWVVDSIPVLKYMPSWMPGANFKRLAAKWRREVYQLNDVPFEWVKTQMTAGDAYPSIMSQLLTTESGDPVSAQEEDMIKWVSAGFYAAGTDTTAAVMTIFFWAMSLFPDAQRKAQREIEHVLENRRLPSMDDQKSLPFVCALIKEVHRWCPAGTIALPHRLTEDDEYNGYFIPKGTTVLTNRWAMLHDPAIYPEPHVFKPERFLDSPGHPAELDPELMIFGFGRRSCMGVHVANASLFLQVASILATFDISKPKDSNGREIDEAVHFSTGIVGHASPFRCSIVARSQAAIDLIEMSA